VPEEGRKTKKISYLDLRGSQTEVGEGNTGAAKQKGGSCRRRLLLQFFCGQDPGGNEKVGGIGDQGGKKKLIVVYVIRKPGYEDLLARKRSVASVDVDGSCMTKKVSERRLAKEERQKTKRRYDIREGHRA